MFLLNKIKYHSDINYDDYEKTIDEYYKTTTNMNMISLTDYIYRFYIQRSFCDAYNKNIKIIIKIQKYIQNLYYEYSKYYIKNVISIYFIVKE